MERRLLRSGKLESLGVLAGGIAHNFNNPLAVIPGNLELTQLKLPAGSPTQHNIEDALDACQRVADVVEVIHVIRSYYRQPKGSCGMVLHSRREYPPSKRKSHPCGGWLFLS
jgi:C4-dicarboxylate-specific signal transduction histidine kinase